jgi:hypothetical protein
MRQGKWDALTRWMHIALQVVGIAIAAALLREPSLLTFSPTAINPETGDVLSKVFGSMVPLVLIIVIVVSSIEIVKDVIKLLRPQKASYPFDKPIS